MHYFVVEEDGDVRGAAVYLPVRLVHQPRVDLRNAFPPKPEPPRKGFLHGADYGMALVQWSSDWRWSSVGISIL